MFFGIFVPAEVVRVVFNVYGILGFEGQLRWFSVFVVYFSKISQCSGYEGRLRRIRWFSVFVGYYIVR